jgi:hypothetical protein
MSRRSATAGAGVVKIRYKRLAGVAAACGFAGSIRNGSIIAFGATIRSNFIG